MIIRHPIPAFTAALSAAGLTASDVAIRDVNGGREQQVQPLSMKGLRFLIWDLGIAVPAEDIATLQCNLLASIAGKSTAWPQT